VDHPALAAAGIRVSHRDLNDGTVEGLIHLGGRVSSVQFPGRPAPPTRRGLFDAALLRTRSGRLGWRSTVEPASCPDHRLGAHRHRSGGRVPDYAGVRPSLALRGEGSRRCRELNPATVRPTPTSAARWSSVRSRSTPRTDHRRAPP
jgi:hypothetical protein